MPDELARQLIEANVWKTAANISPLYRLDGFDWAMFVLYFAVLRRAALRATPEPREILRPCLPV